MYRWLTRFPLSGRHPFIPFCLLLLCAFSACATDGGIGGRGGWDVSALQEQQVRALAVTPLNPTTIYAGTAQGEIFVSNDAGQHWQEQSTGLPASSSAYGLAFDTSGKKLFAFGEKGLFVWRAGRWQPVLAPSLPVDTYSALAFDFKAPQALFLATATHGVYLSQDSGKTWQAINIGLPSRVVVRNLAYVTDQQRLWLASDQGVYRSDNRGGSWQSFSNGLPQVPVSGVVPVAASGGAQNLVYAGTQRGFFVSQDDGKHWAPGRDSLANTTVYTTIVDFRSTDAKAVLIGTNFGVFRSEDQGQTWSIVASGLPKKTAVYALSLADVRYERLFAAADKLYVYPGSGGDVGGNILPIALFLGFFGLLYYIAQRSRKRHIATLNAREAQVSQTEEKKD